MWLLFNLCAPPFHTPYNHFFFLPTCSHHHHTIILNLQPNLISSYVEVETEKVKQPGPGTSKVEVSQSYKWSCLKRLYYEIAKEPDAFRLSVAKTFGRLGADFDETLEVCVQ